MVEGRKSKEIYVRYQSGKQLEHTRQKSKAKWYKAGSQRKWEYSLSSIKTIIKRSQYNKKSDRFDNLMKIEWEKVLLSDSNVRFYFEKAIHWFSVRQRLIFKVQLALSNNNREKCSKINV